MKQGNHWSCFILSSHLNKWIRAFRNDSQKNAKSSDENREKINSKENSPSDSIFDAWLDQDDSQAEGKHDAHNDEQCGKNTEDTFFSKLFRCKFTDVCRDQSHKQTYHNALQRSAYKNSVYVLNLNDSFDDEWKNAKDKGEFPEIKENVPSAGHWDEENR